MLYVMPCKTKKKKKATIEQPFIFVSSLSHTPILSSISVVSFHCEQTGETSSNLTFDLSALTLDHQLVSFELT